MCLDGRNVVRCDGMNNEFYPLSTEETELRENGWMTRHTKIAIKGSRWW
jgi:hypothetical protein